MFFLHFTNNLWIIFSCTTLCLPYRQKWCCFSQVYSYSVHCNMNSFCSKGQEASTIYHGFPIISPQKIAWLLIEVKQSTNAMAMRFCRSSSAGPEYIGWKNCALDFFRSYGKLQINNQGDTAGNSSKVESNFKSFHSPGCHIREHVGGCS